MTQLDVEKNRLGRYEIERKKIARFFYKTHYFLNFAMELRLTLFLQVIENQLLTHKK